MPGPDRSEGPPSRVAVGAACTTAAVATTAGLLRRMRREFDSSGRLSPPTVVWMYGTYLAHAGLTAVAVSTIGPGRGATGGRTLTTLGYSTTGLGTALFAAGMSRFSSATQVSGMTSDQLVGAGAYRWSRNPQYAGYVAALSGLAVARRSFVAGALAGVAAAAFAWWVPVEERHLARQFGPAYRRYLDLTPRWFGVPHRPDLRPTRSSTRRA